MSIKHFIREAGKGLKSPVYFLYSEEAYLLREASEAASETLPDGEREFGLHIFDLSGADEKPSFDQISDVLNTMPFTGERKIVVVENVQDLAKKDMGKLDLYAANPSPYAVLLLLHLGSPKAQFKEFMKKTKAISLDLRQQDFPHWIRERAGQKGLVLTERAVEYLLGSVGADVGLLSSEIEKCALIGKRPIDREDLVRIVSGSSDYSVFDLVAAIRDKDAERVFRIAGTLRENSDSYILLGAINWHYSRLFSNDRGRKEYYERVFGLLHEADIGIKTSGGAYPLEYLLVKLLRL